MAKDLGSTAFTKHDDEFNSHYRGEVMNNLDPLQKGRIQVQVVPMLQGVTPTLLPWAIPASPLFSGAGSGFGTFEVPEIGSWVWVFFEMGSIYQPVYFAEASDGEHGVPAESQVNYPHRRVIHTKAGIVVYTDDSTKTVSISTPAGHKLFLDDATKVSTLQNNNGMKVELNQNTNYVNILHPTGAFIQIDAAGEILINGSNIVITTDGTTTWTGTGNINITSSGVISLTGSSILLNP